MYDLLSFPETALNIYNNRGGCYKRGEFAKVPELINEEEGIDEDDGMVWKTWRVPVPKRIRKRRSVLKSRGGC